MMGLRIDWLGMIYLLGACYFIGYFGLKVDIITITKFVGISIGSAFAVLFAGLFLLRIIPEKIIEALIWIILLIGVFNLPILYILFKYVI